MVLPTIALGLIGCVVFFICFVLPYLLIILEIRRDKVDRPKLYADYPSAWDRFKIYIQVNMDAIDRQAREDRGF